VEEKQEVSSKLQRAGILIIAIVFIVSTIGIGVFYVLQAQKDNNDAKAKAAAIKAITAQQTKPTTGEKNMLKGTTLQNFTPVARVATLQVSDPTPGTGAEVKTGDTVTVNYTGALASNGTIFESSLDSGQTATFGLDQVIKGWTEGIPGMKVGGTRRLLIPSALAYGTSGAGSSIPPNADLVFDVTLVKIGK
jgi:FKBP-type peptidyl-prolyl cis-trans isomerase